SRAVERDERAARAVEDQERFPPVDDDFLRQRQGRRIVTVSADGVEELPARVDLHDAPARRVEDVERALAVEGQRGRPGHAEALERGPVEDEVGAKRDGRTEGGFADGSRIETGQGGARGRAAERGGEQDDAEQAVPRRMGSHGNLDWGPWTGARGRCRPANALPFE